MKSMKDNEDKDMLKEYDFGKGVRGKYIKAYREGSKIVPVEPEDEKAAPDSKKRK